MNNPNDYFEYNGKKYGVGTMYRYKSSITGEYVYDIYWGNNSNGKYVFGQLGSNISGSGWDPKEFQENKDIEIIEVEKTNNRISKGKPTSYVDTSIGWIWYIIIMIVGAIFNDRFLIWIMTTIIFFLWKNGKLRGKK